MDDMALRGLKIVGPYKRDLIEIESFRQRVRSTARQESSLAGPAGSTSLTMDFSGNDINGGAQPEQQVVFESALESLNCSFPDYLLASELDPLTWVWGDQLDDVEVPARPSERGGHRVR